MKTSELIKKLKKQGVIFHSNGKNHDWYINTNNGKMTQIGRHGSKEIPTGTYNDIMQKLGLKP
ncbi:MAG: type II toxin-antitoxin system HicA family toxin [Defluviitaleaceae bacterium]|nr:type II toxin-antitoxin system HicA family toxin [Defluviitaleaceae bacterium]